MTTQPNAFLITATGADPVAHPLTLGAMQSTVGGYIEPAFTVASPTRKGYAVTGYVNDSGLIDGLPITALIAYEDSNGAHPLSGPLLVCGLDTTNGETVPLTLDEIEWVQRRTYLYAAGGTPESFAAIHLLMLPND